MTTAPTRGIRAVCITAAVALLAACGSGAPEPPAAIEPAVGFTFNSTQRPSIHYGRTLEMLLDASGVALAGQEDAEPDAPVYADIEFFPVLDADALAALTRGYGRRNDHGADIAAIDFATHFALVIAHPASPNLSGMSDSSGSPGVFFSTPSLQYAEDGIDIEISARRLGGSMAADTLAFGTPWEAKVYAIERRNAGALRVRLYDDLYRFPLTQDAGASESTDDGSTPGADDGAA